MNDTGHLGRKLDDSLPDFVTFVVSRFLKWGKRGGNQRITVDLRRKITIKKPAKAGFFANCRLPKQSTINVWRTEDDDVLYADRLSYVQPDEHHG
ncbi:hypothetical protein AM363_25760 [Citrobacter freundii]|uniref:Uncharacterized protein n=1 Tax=Citrobacter freundii TaxID=546 RepID=A0AB33H8C3_CITFR|nr:hypothetical protein AM349_14645 [Citrobacter freundii]PSF20908.1 hypothetical protein C6985_19750 [Escherichia coli]AUU28008.1 hypothetical protein MC62_019540 [Citrobacter freundii]AXZ50078.1 hypothetical protein AM363_25760 [Citrobacter freundii]AYL44037.1 hypothetical protein CUC45_18140 [Citrobacter freundii]